MGSRFEGLDFSHEGVKRVIGLFTGFVSVIASASHGFLYLNQRIHNDKKKKKKRRKKTEKKKKKKRKKTRLLPLALKPLFGPPRRSWPPSPIL